MIVSLWTALAILNVLSLYLMYAKLRRDVRSLDTRVRDNTYSIVYNKRTQTDVNDLTWQDTSSLWRVVLHLEKSKINNPFHKGTHSDD